MNYSNFELIYRNAIPPSQTYKFINVVDDLHVASSVIFTIQGEKYALHTSLEGVSMYANNPKEYCVKKSINESRLFLKNAWYLYKQDGVFGRYNIEKLTFEPFDDADAEQKVHAFYYYTLREPMVFSRDKPLGFA
jgi:hypothetical protein